jgi:regulation of enolase protein 1 (concanavalin A-like superfamily)
LILTQGSAFLGDLSNEYVEFETLRCLGLLRSRSNPFAAFWQFGCPRVLPSGWTDSDIGSVGVSGSATYASNVFTVQGGGSTFLSTTADAFNFAYMPLSGDGTITARVTSTNSYAQVGVMIRETLDAGSDHMLMDVYAGSVYETYRTGGDGSNSSYNYGGGGAVPIWVRIVRSGSSFTITMAQNVYVGLAVAGSGSTAYTATFDNVSLSSAASPTPAITGVSATTGSVGSQIVVSGSGFGASQGSSAALLQGVAATINSWSDTSITITIPSGATSGDLVVSVAPSMNDSNPVYFTVTGTPLPTGWLDQDIGEAGVVGSAGYASSVFTVQGGGNTFLSTTADAFHFAYLPLSGDGTITARVTSTNSYAQVGVMIRETLDAGSDHMLMDVYAGSVYEAYRTGGDGSNSSYNYGGGGAVPIWVRIVRSGSSFTGYSSSDGINWTQVGTSQTISMAQNVYMGSLLSKLTDDSTSGY